MPDKTILFMSPGSHHSRRVRLLIHELGLDVEERPVGTLPRGMGGENEKPEFLAINPFGKVPVLQDGDLIVAESNAIMYYLCEKHGPSTLWPAELPARAKIQSWQFAQAAHLSPVADGLLLENVVKPMLGKPSDAAIVSTLTDEFHRLAAVLDATLSNQPYLLGQDITCADLSIATALMYAPAAQIPVAEHAPLSAWLARIHARASWKTTEPPPMRG